MFGIFRTMLALVVVGEHLGPVAHVGPYAVFGFYALSGYLMTAILHDRYGYTTAGRLRYGANRLLRIYPLYLVAVGLSVLLISLVGESAARAYHAQMGLSATPTEVLRNLLLVLQIGTETRWVPPAWALTIELCFYVLIGLGLSRRPRVTAAWLALSLAYTIYLTAGGASFSYRYFTLMAASLPFALGASLFHLRRHPRWPLALVSYPATLWFASIAFGVNLASASFIGGPSTYGVQFYLSLALAVLLIAHLAGRRPGGRLARADAQIGEMSSPVYLLHYQGGLLLLWLGVDGARGEVGFMVAGTAVTLLLAVIVSRTLEPGIQRLRAIIRPPAPAAG
jgi:peptidoglycan/LPS O-acetylase OafA/YrhL